MDTNSGEVSLNINKIAQSLRKNSATLEPLSSECCIYKVLPHLYSLNREAYTPKIVSIGPFHHGKKQLRSMETHKLRYLNAFLELIQTTVEEFIEGLKKLEINLRKSYSEINEHNREKFMEIMAVDGAFLMYYLLVNYCGEFEENDRVFGRQYMHSNVKYDLLLLENQLPFSYLEYLFALYKESNDIDEEITLMKITRVFLNETATPWNFHLTDVTEERQVHHLLHLLIICLNPSQMKVTKDCTSLSTPTISELHQAGVKFRPNSTNCIKFENGILEIPILRVTDPTEQLFRNMQAFEQCHKFDHIVGDYICTMDILINGEEDVKVLVQEGIIENWLEDNRVAANVFNNLGKGNYIDCSDFYYTQVIEDLNAHYKIKRHRWKATLRHKYFNNPWTIISVIAASFLLLFTIIQTICSILQVV